MEGEVKVTRHPDCQMDVEPFKQCCCNCQHHLPVHFHCCTEPKPDLKGSDSKCVCNVQKGWACVPPELDVVYDNWREHSVGCEMYDPKEPK